MPNMLATARAVAGTWPAAVLLLRTAFWHTKTTIEQDGARWVVMTRQSWMEDTGLSDKELRGAFERLRALGFIRVERRVHQHCLKSWMTLLPAGEKALKPDPQAQPEDVVIPPSGADDTDPAEGGDLPLGAHSTCPQGHIVPAPRGVKFLPLGAPPNIESNRESNREVNMETGAPKGARDKIPRIKTGLTVEEITLMTQAKKVPVPEKGTPANLEAVWKTKVSEATGQYVPPMTHKQKGQLGHFAKRCPPGEAMSVLSGVLADWIGFAKSVEVTQGLKTSPLHPNIDFLLKHVGPAVDFHKAQTAPPAQPSAPVPSSNPAPVVQSVALPLEDAPQTLDELLNILHGNDPE